MENILTLSKYDRLERVKDVIIRNLTEFLLNCYVERHIKKSHKTVTTSTKNLFFFWIGNKPLSLPTTNADVRAWKRFPPWWRHQMETFPRYRPFVRGIHRSPVNSPHKGQWRVALVFSFICVWINGWVNNRETGDLRRHHTRYDLIVMHSEPCAREIHWSMVEAFIVPKMLK